MRERIDVNPLRAFDSDHEGTRGVMASAPTIVERARGRGRRALRRGAGAARRRRHRLRDRPDPGPRPRLLHADDLLLRLRRARRPVGDRRRRPLRRPDRAARRAGRRRRSAGRPGSSGSCWPWTRRRRAPEPRDALRRRRRGRAAPRGRWRWRASCATPASPPSSTSAAAGSRASSSRPTGSAPAASCILEDDGGAQLRDMESGEQRPIDTGPRDDWSGSRVTARRAA